MNCPHCHKKLPTDYSSPWCPFCGKDWEDAPGSGVARKFPWLFFWLVLLAPAIVDFIVLTLVSNSMGMFLIAVPITFIGSLISGIVCGITLARWKGSRGLHFFSQVILNSIAMAVVSFGLCFIGCTAPAIFRPADNNF